MVGRGPDRSSPPPREAHQFAVLPSLICPARLTRSHHHATTRSIQQLSLSPYLQLIESPSPWLPHDARQGWPATPRQGTQGPHWLPHLQVSTEPAPQRSLHEVRDPISRAPGPCTPDPCNDTSLTKCVFRSKNCHFLRSEIAPPNHS